MLSEWIRSNSKWGYDEAGRLTLKLFNWYLTLTSYQSRPIVRRKLSSFVYLNRQTAEVAFKRVKVTRGTVKYLDGLNKANEKALAEDEKFDYPSRFYPSYREYYNKRGKDNQWNGDKGED